MHDTTGLGLGLSAFGALILMCFWVTVVGALLVILFWVAVGAVALLALYWLVRLFNYGCARLFAYVERKQP